MAVGFVDDDLVGAEGLGGKVDTRGGIVEDGEAEGVEGAELDDGGSILAASALAGPVEGGAHLVGYAEEREFGEEGYAQDLRR